MFKVTGENKYGSTMAFLDHQNMDLNAKPLRYLKCISPKVTVKSMFSRNGTNCYNACAYVTTIKDIFQTFS